MAMAGGTENVKECKAHCAEEIPTLPPAGGAVLPFRQDFGHHGHYLVEDAGSNKQTSRAKVPNLTQTGRYVQIDSIWDPINGI